MRRLAPSPGSAVPVPDLQRLAGTYRIRHRGTWKSGLYADTFTDYDGFSAPFEVR